MIYIVIGILSWIAVNAALGFYSTPWKDDKE